MKSAGCTRWLITAPFVLGLLCRPATGMGAAPEIPPLSGNPRHGRDIYVDKGCIACHTVRESGGKVGPDLAAALVGKGVVGIAAAMLNHYPTMSAAWRERGAALPVLGAGDMDDLVAYLLFVNFLNEPGSVERGRVLFSRKGCGQCHGLFPGGSSVGPPLGRGMLDAPPIRVAQTMWNHGTQMRATMDERHVRWTTFTGEEMADLLAFLGAAVGPLPGRGAALPGDPLAGRDLFESKGCPRCHLTTDTGQTVGPDLVTGHWFKTATEIAGAMWNHGPAMWARMNQAGVEPPRFEDDEMAHVIAYLYLLRSAQAPGVPARGARVFREKHCAHCHDGGGAGPDLVVAEGLDTPIHLAAEMWNHAPRMQAFLSDAKLPWPVFAASEVNDLVSYLRERRAAQ